MMTITVSVDHQPQLVVRGTIAGPELHRYGEALEQIARTPERTVGIDLSGVDDWSLVAQAMTLSTARRMARRGGELVLYGPTESLRSQSHPMNIFERIATRDSLPPTTHPPTRSTPRH